MARNHTQIRLDIWMDDDWRALTPGAQHLYLVILTDPALSYAGVTDWKPGRIRQRANEWSLESLMVAAQELSDGHFLIFDDETEEVAVRSYLRHDGLMKQPRMAVSMAMAFALVGSNKIRAAIVYELARLKKQNPEWDAWTNPKVMTVLKQNAVNPREMTTDLALPAGIDFGVRLPGGLAHDLPSGLPMGLPQTAGNVSDPPTPSSLLLTPSPSPSSDEDALPNSIDSAHPSAGAA